MFLLRLLASGEEGQTMAEYGVTLGVITLTLIAALGLVTGKIQTVLADVASFI